MACGPGLPGGTPIGQPITDTDGDSDSRGTLTNADSTQTATVTASSSDTIDDSGTTYWDCGGTDIIMEHQCFPPPSDTDGGTGTGSATDGGTDTDTDTDAGEEPLPPPDSATDGGLCDGYLDNPPVDNYYGELIELNGPFVEDGMCCYDVTYEVQYPCGRPFYVQDRPRVADLAARRDWADRERPDVDGLDPYTRRRLAEAWLEDALAEHASIASFARFAMQLLSLGAPPELLADTHAAMNDELEHARLCFALASAYAGRELGPGTLPIANALLDALDLEAAVVSAIREGCIGETMAAMQAEVAFGLAGDPAVLRALDRIKQDEAAHAALAWRFVDWAVKSGGNRIREVAREAFDRWAPTAAGNTAGPSPDLQRHGRLHDSDLALLQRRTYDEVIRPCANALLAVPFEPELQLAGLPA